MESVLLVHVEPSCDKNMKNLSGVVPNGFLRAD